MAKRSVKRLGLRENLLQRLNKHHLFTCKDVLSLTQLESMKLLGLTLQGYKDLTSKVSKLSAPKPKTAYDILKFRQKCPCQGYLKLSLRYLDDILHGGLPFGTITEIVGPPGIGKTQICFMLTVVASLPLSYGGMDGKIIYIDTESAFSAHRIIEIAKTRFPEVYSESKALELTQKIYLHQVNSTDCLKQILQKLHTDIIKCGAKLVILDSVASLVRKEFDPGDSRKRIERTAIVAEYAAILKEIAETFMIPVVVTNQITMRPIQTPQTTESSVQKEGYATSGRDPYRVTAALGTLWSHCINTRLIAQFTKEGKRQLLVAKSPVAPTFTANYRILNNGIVLEDGSCVPFSARDPSTQAIATRFSVTSVIS